MEIGVSVIDRFTFYTLEFFEKMNLKYRVPSLSDLVNIHIFIIQFSSYNPNLILSQPQHRKDLFNRPLQNVCFKFINIKVPITDFFGSDIKIHVTEEDYPLAAR